MRPSNEELHAQEIGVQESPRRGLLEARVHEGYVGADADTMSEQMKKVTTKEDESKDSGDNNEDAERLVKGG
jgi:hypothetical protein